MAVAIARRSTGYDLMLAIRSIAKEGDHCRLTGPEFDAHARAADAMGLDPYQTRGLLVPVDQLIPKRSAPATSDVASTIPTRLSPAAVFGDLLRAKAVVGRLGGRFVSIFNGYQPLAIPTKTSSAAAQWIAPDDDVTFGKLAMAGDDNPNPQVVAAATTVTRKLWGSTTDDVHDFIVADLAGGMAAAVDKAVLTGVGDLEPVGLFNEDLAVPTVSLGTDGGALTRAKLVEAMRTVHAANGDSPAGARMGWAASVGTEAKLRLTDGGMGDGPLWANADSILGKPAAATTGIGDDFAKGSGEGLGGLAYGNWSDLIINMPPVVQLIVDPVTLAANGGIRLVAFWDVKVTCRHAASFCLFSDVVTS